MIGNKSRKSLRIHPAARTAFECIAAVLPTQSMGAPRAVRVDDEVLIFAGFVGLGKDRTVPPCIEKGLSDAEIEAAAWADVSAVWALIAAAPAGKKSVADALTATAPPAVLREAGLPDQRDAQRARKTLRLAPQDRTDPVLETIYARRKALFEASYEAQRKTSGLGR